MGIALFCHPKAMAASSNRSTPSASTKPIGTLPASHEPQSQIQQQLDEGESPCPAHSHRVANTRKDFLHKASCQISQSHAMIAIEDLQVQHVKVGQGQQRAARQGR